MHSNPQRAALALIRGYQLVLSPLFAGSCRFVPSCSAYAAEAIGRYGVIRGIGLAARRLGRCHPFGGHGMDPVPAPRPSELPSSPTVVLRVEKRYTRRRGKQSF